MRQTSPISRPQFTPLSALQIVVVDLGWPLHIGRLFDSPSGLPLDHSPQRTNRRCLPPAGPCNRYPMVGHRQFPQRRVDSRPAGNSGRADQQSNSSTARKETQNVCVPDRGKWAQISSFHSDQYNSDTTRTNEGLRPCGSVATYFQRLCAAAALRGISAPAFRRFFLEI